MRTALALVLGVAVTMGVFFVTHRPFYWLAEWGQDAGVGGPLVVILMIAAANGYAAHLGSYVASRAIRGISVKAYGWVFAGFSALLTASTLFGPDGPGGLLTIIALVVITGLIAFGAYLGAMLGQMDSAALKASKELAIAGE